MTRFTTFHSFPIPQDGQDNWSDELDQTFNSIDAILKGISENKLTKDTLFTNSFVLKTSGRVNPNTPFVWGDSFSIRYDDMTRFTTFTDESLPEPEDILTFEHGDGGFITSHRQLRFGNGDLYALQSYVDEQTNVDGDISPTSVTTNVVDAPLINETHYAYPTDDLQAKLDALNPRDELVINGDHIHDATLTIPSNCTITLNGTTTLADGVQDHLWESQTGENIHIRGTGTITGNKHTLTDDGGNNVGSTGIRLRNPTGPMSIKGITIRETRDAAINANDINQLLIDGVIIRNTGLSTELADGIYVNGNDVRISNCLIINVRDSHIAIGRTSRFTITNNVCYNTDPYITNVGPAAQCMGLSSATDPCNGTIAGNSLGNVGYAPGSGTRSILTDWDHSHSTDNNINRRVAITGNYCWGKCEYGIKMTDSPNTAVVGNVLDLDDASVGIQYGGGIVANNTIRQADIGISSIAGQRPSMIMSNHIYFPDDNGIQVVTDDTHVSNNFIRTAANEGIKVGASGLTVSGVSVSHNSVWNAGGVGIAFVDTVKDSTFMGNTVRLCDAFGFQGSGMANRNSYVGNVLSDNASGDWNVNLDVDSKAVGNIPTLS